MKILEKSNFEGLKDAKKLSPEEVIAELKEEELVGRGGAGFPTGIKWEFTRKARGQEKYLICNADEGEPGTFKDKFILEKNPALVIEGMAIASYAIGCKKAYIYLRREYAGLKKKIEKTISSAQPHLNNLKIELVVGAGAYICGDETSIMNSIEGVRAMPRKKPPYPAQQGLWGKPTCVNNVETLANVALLFVPTEYDWDKNLRLFSVSGDVKNPGIFEEKLGVRLGKLIEKAKPKNKIKAISFGAAGGILPYQENLLLHPKIVEKRGAMLGSCTVIAIDEKQCLVDFCKNLVEFFVHESCGKCTPCREGNYRLLEYLDKVAQGKASRKDLKLIEDLAKFIAITSFCPLGESSTTHLITSLKYFRKEFERKCR